MLLKNDHYTYRVSWSEEDAEYIGLCAEFPSLSWLAAEPEAALQGIRQVVADVMVDPDFGSFSNFRSLPFFHIAAGFGAGQDGLDGGDQGAGSFNAQFDGHTRGRAVRLVDKVEVEGMLEGRVEGVIIRDVDFF
jgi:hypothetical protein